MPNGRCHQARSEYDAALYEKEHDTDKKIRDAKLKRNLSIAGGALSLAAAGAGLLTGNLLWALVGLGAGAFGVWKAYQTYKAAEQELDAARQRCQQLIAAAQEAFNKLLRYCTEEQLSREEREQLRTEVTGLSCD